jgi:hypothetical protein
MNTDQLVRRSLDKLADAVHTNPPPLYDLLDRPTNLVARRRPRRALVAASVGGMIALAGATAVAAAVLIPDRVANQLGDEPGQRQAGVTIRTDQAEQHATHTASDGTTYELWIAPEAGGGTCRTVTSSSEPLDSDQWAAVCTPTPFGTSTTNIGAYDTFVIGDHIAIFGSAPGATTATIDINGTTLNAAVVNGEYFTVRDEPCTLEQRANCLSNISIRTLDASGNVIETLGN